MGGGQDTLICILKGIWPTPRQKVLAGWLDQPLNLVEPGQHGSQVEDVVRKLCRLAWEGTLRGAMPPGWELRKQEVQRDLYYPNVLVGGHPGLPRRTCTEKGLNSSEAAGFLGTV